jgi:hypothetical protein
LIPAVIKHRRIDVQPEPRRRLVGRRAMMRVSAGSRREERTMAPEKVAERGDAEE